MTLNGMFTEPKPHRMNFIKENKKKLKQISSMVNQNAKSTNPDLTKYQSSQTDVDRKLHSSSSKLNSKPASSGKLNRKSTITVFMRDKRKDEVTSSTALFTPQRSSFRSISIIKDESCQTIDPKNYDQLFHEGTIMYPSSKVLEELAKVEKEKANRLDVHVKKEFFRKNAIKSRSPSKVTAKTSIPETKKETEEKQKYEEQENKSLPAPQVQNPPKSKESEVKVINKPKTKDSRPSLNAADIIRKTTEDHIRYSPRINQQNPDGTFGLPTSCGDAAPNHIQKTQKKPVNKKNKKEEEEVLKAVMDPMCPPGHIPLPDNERKKTLHMLRVSYAELIREMNLLPVRTDTLRIRQRKIQLENQLNKIEEGIKVFNKSKVYVKIED